ncbi:MAG: hypothetical protein U9Q27_00175 [Patescibacteria group bacterium]|nr:hypothetical protein [Patescibacteria group bacterium]
MKRPKRLTQRQKKELYTTIENWRQNRKNKIRKEIAMKLNKELKKYFSSNSVNNTTLKG